ncbi:MAG: hypothetical protein GX115_01600 [Ruminiclostridium sp.]|nr:hypothetical protein [Ruminiclostridium sp.]
MKKIATILLITSVLFIFTGCGSSESLDTEGRHDASKLYGTWEGENNDYYVFTEDGMYSWHINEPDDDYEPYEVHASQIILQPGDDDRQCMNFQFEGDDILFLGYCGEVGTSKYERVK